MTSYSQYWCPHRLVVSVTGARGTFSLTTKGPFARVGSDRGAEVALRDKRVPRRGYYFHATEDGVFWIDLTAGEDVQEVRHGWLAPEETLSLGPYRIGARLADEGGAASASRPDLCAKQTVPSPGPSVAFLLHDKVVTRSRLSRRLTLVGRCRPSSLRVRKNDVSASHLVLYWQAGALWAIDLLSRNGTHLDGMAIDAAELSVGDSLKLGHVLLRYVRSAPAADVPVPATPRPAVSESLLSPTPPTRPLPADQKKPEREQPSIQQQREAWLREQAERQSQWNKRVEEFGARHAAAQACEEAWQQARLRRETELAEREARLDEEASRQKIEAEDLDRQRQNWRDAQDRVDSQVASQRQELAQFQAEREQIAAARAQLAAERVEFLTDRQRLEAEREELLGERAAVLARLSEEGEPSAQTPFPAPGTPADELDLLRSTLQREQAALRTAQEAWEASVSQRRAELAAQETRLADQRLALSDQRAELDGQIVMIQAASQQLEAEQAEFTRQRAAAMLQQQTAKEQLDREWGALRESRLECEERRRMLDREEAALRAGQEAMASEGKNRLAEVAQREKSCDEQKAAIEAQRGELGRAQAGLHAAWRQLEAERLDFQRQTAATAAEQQATRDRLDHEGRALESQRQALEQQRALAHSAREQLEAERAELERQQTATMAQVQELKAQLDEERGLLRDSLATLEERRSALDRAQAALGAAQEALARDQAAILATQQARETHWQQRSEELARQQELFAQRQAVFEEEFHSHEQVRSEVQAARAELEAQRAALAEREAGLVELLRQVPLHSDAPHVSPEQAAIEPPAPASASPALPRPPAQEGGEPVLDEELEVRNDEVLERLSQTLREESGWWHRMRSAFVRGPQSSEQ